MSFTNKALLAAIAVLACTAVLGTGSASATVLCKTNPSTHVCPAADVYGQGTDITAHSEGVLKFKGGGESIITSCTGSNFSATVLDQGSATTVASLTEVDYEFSGCSNPSAHVGNGAMSVAWTSGTHNGSAAEQLGNRLQWTIFGSKCTYTMSLPVKFTGGSSALLSYSDTRLLKYEGNLGCPEELKMDAAYAVEAPAALYVEQEAASAPKSVLCKSNPESHSCPAEDVYGIGTSISAQIVPGSSFTLKTNGGSVVAECSSSTYSAVVASEGGEATAVRLSGTEHSYSGCSRSVTPVTTGEAVVNWSSGTVNGLLTQSGSEAEWGLFGVKCTYSIAGGEIQGGAEPKLFYSSTPVLKTAGSGLCPKELKAFAEYDIESPTPLYVQQ